MNSAIVIGGGIAGCSTAYALAKRGIAVTLIERHDKLASEASGNPLAMLYPKLSIKPSMQSALALQGLEFTLNLLQNLPASQQFFDACGQIQLAFNARQQANQAVLADLYQLQVLSANAASEIAGKFCNKFKVNSKPCQAKVLCILDLILSFGYNMASGLPEASLANLSCRSIKVTVMPR